MIREPEASGFALVRGAIPEGVISELRNEFTRLAESEGTPSVRNAAGRSETIARLAWSEEWRALLPDPSVSPVRSILFDKTPGHNWPVAWHQDLTIALAKRRETDGYRAWSIKDGVPHARPPADLLERMITLRLHLDDCPEENGALRVLPGSHRRGILDDRSIGKIVAVTEETVCACRAGDALLMRPLLVHSSRRAEAPAHRRILHLEFAPREALAPGLAWFEPAPATAAS